MAGGFTFRLEVLLRVRKQERDAQRRVVAEVLRRISAIEWRVEEATEALRTERDRAREARGAMQLEVAALRGHQSYTARLHRRIHEGQSELAEQRGLLEQERRKLAETSKRLKAIEKLREKHWQRYLLEQRRTERAAEDEVAVQRYIRQRVEIPSEDRV